MEKVRLGKTNLMVTKTAFGALPVQRVPMDGAIILLRKAYDCGINFFDTARGYSDSEEKLGNALSDVRHNIIIATKSPAKNVANFWIDLETSLRSLKTDYIDILQFHNPSSIPLLGSEDGLYEAALKAKEQGKLRHIGITNHSIVRAKEAIETGLYETLQFPFSHLAAQIDIDLVNECKTLDVGFIAMKALSGGLITNAKAAFAYMGQFDTVVPIWGVQRETELAQFVEYDANPPILDDELIADIEKDKLELGGDFCRGCGYCAPCPVGIPINMAARMTQLLKRSPVEPWLTESWQENMAKVNDCTRCGACAKRCPYDLKPYDMLPAHLEFYNKMVKEYMANQ